MNTPLSVSCVAICVVLALMLRRHYARLGSTTSNRAEFVQVFPFILPTTILITSVVKSCLALSLDWNGDGDSQPDKRLKQINKVIWQYVSANDLRRFDMRKCSLGVTCLFDISSPSCLSELIDELRRQFPVAGVPFLDQNQQPSG